MDPYLTLDVSRDCTRDEVKEAFRSKAQHAHPDRGGEELTFIQLRAAYNQILVELDRRPSRGTTRSPIPPDPGDTQEAYSAWLNRVSAVSMRRDTKKRWASRHKVDRRLSFQESLDTFMLGALSTSLGIFIVVEFFRSKSCLPASVFVLITSTGACLGIAGNLMARRRGRAMSPLSALGTMLCLMPMALISILLSLLLSLLLIVLAVVFLPVIGLIVLPIYGALVGTGRK